MFRVKESDHVTSLQDVLNVFFVLQEEINLPTCLGIDNVDLFTSRHIEELVIGSHVQDLHTVDKNKTGEVVTDLLSGVDRGEDDLITHHHVISIGSQL